MAHAAPLPDRCLVTTAATVALEPSLDQVAAPDYLKAYHDVFMMFEYKVRPCPDAWPHDWNACPYAHPGEAARRRDPARVSYSAKPCPDFRRGGGACLRGDGCPLAHGTFEQWLHPSRYRTRSCLSGLGCPRRVCFFAHTDRELRLAAAGSPMSTLTAAWQGSPPSSPMGGGNASMGMEGLTGWRQLPPPPSPIGGGGVNMDMERWIALQQIGSAGKEMQDAMLFPTSSGLQQMIGTGKEMQEAMLFPTTSAPKTISRI